MTRRSLVSRFQEVIPLDLRQLRTALAARRIGRLEIKKRGVDCDPEKLRAQLRPAGDASATLIVTRIGSKPVAILAGRVPVGCSASTGPSS